MERTFILVGGAPTTGKSTIALALAERLGLPYISTDQIRDMIMPYTNKKQCPNLFCADGFTAEEFLTKYTPQEIVEMEYEQGEEVWPGVLGLLKTYSDWPKGGVVEGVNILPHLVAQEGYRNKDLVKSVFLVDLDEERMRKVIYTRGLYGGASTYSDDVKEQEVKWAMLFAQRLKAEAQKHGLPVVDVTKTEADLDNVLKILGTEK